MLAHASSSRMTTIAISSSDSGPPNWSVSGSKVPRAPTSRRSPRVATADRAAPTRRCSTGRARASLRAPARSKPRASTAPSAPPRPRSHRCGNRAKGHPDVLPHAGGHARKIGLGYADDGRVHGAGQATVGDVDDGAEARSSPLNCACQYASSQPPEGRRGVSSETSSAPQRGRTPSAWKKFP